MRSMVADPSVVAAMDAAREAVDALVAAVQAVSSAISVTTS